MNCINTATGEGTQLKALVQFIVDTHNSFLNDAIQALGLDKPSTVLLDLIHKDHMLS